MSTELQRRSPPRGFSLLEVMLSGTIFLLGFAGTLSAITTALSLYGQQRRSTHGIQVAESLMEELLMKYPSAADLSPGTHAGPAYDREGRSLAATAPTSAGYYQSEWQVTAERPLAGMRELRLRVTWPGALRPIEIVSARR